MVNVNQQSLNIVSRLREQLKELDQLIISHRENTQPTEEQIHLHNTLIKEIHNSMKVHIQVLFTVLETNSTEILNDVAL